MMKILLLLLLLIASNNEHWDVVDDGHFVDNCCALCLTYFGSMLTTDCWLEGLIGRRRKGVKMSSLDAVGSAASFLLLTRLNYFFVQLFRRGRFEARALLRRGSGRRRRGGEEEERRGREVKNSCSLCQNSKSTEFSQNLAARSAQSLLGGPWKITDLRQQNFFSLPQPMHFLLFVLSEYVAPEKSLSPPLLS